MMKTSSGLTLIELLVGITILVIVMGTVYASYRLGIKTYTRIEQETFVNRNLRQAWRTISRDIRCAYISPANKTIRFTGTPDTGDATRPCRLSFVTFFSDTDAVAGGLAEVTYYIDTDPLTPQQGLVRETRCFPLTEPRSAPDRVLEVAPLAASLKLKYFNGIEWKDRWGADDTGAVTEQAGSLPAAVELTVALSVPPGSTEEPETIKTIIPVMSY